MSALVVVVVGLGLPGLLPALVAAGPSAAAAFTAPLVGACMAAVAAELELAIGGTLVAWYVAIAAITNVVVATWVIRAGRARRPVRAKMLWSLATIGVLAATMAVPLLGLRTPMIGYDANAIWLVHTLLVSGGHGALAHGLQNPVYAFSNPDYPPLVPASGALAFALFGAGYLHLAIAVTALLNACGLGVVGVGIASMGDWNDRRIRIVSLLAAAAVCFVGFAVARDYGVSGYADLLWASAAAAAVVWGLVLPLSNRALAVAGICAAVAGLTKNEGLTAALIVLALIGLRYGSAASATWRARARRADGSRGQLLRSGAPRAALLVVPVLPALAWLAVLRHLGIHNAFFEASSLASRTERADAAVGGIAHHLLVAPAAAVVFALGWVFLGGDRRRIRLGNSMWLWGSCVLFTVALLGVYVFGSLEIHWWLRTSVGRTTIFPQLLLYTDLAIWLAIALNWAVEAWASPSA